MSAYAFPFTEIEYPDSDGFPMAESDFRRKCLIFCAGQKLLSDLEAERG